MRSVATIATVVKFAISERIKCSKALDYNAFFHKACRPSNGGHPRQQQGKFRALAKLAAHQDAAAMRPGGSVHNRQA